MKQENSEIGKKVLTDGLDPVLLTNFLQAQCTTSDTKEVVVEQTWLSGTSPRSEGLFCCILSFIEINNFRNIFAPLQSVYHSNINTILVAVGVKLCPKGVSTRITYLLATSFAARLGDLLRPQRLKLRTSSFYTCHTVLRAYDYTTDISTFIHLFQPITVQHCS